MTHALTLAGLKTQAALAERIADLEGLDAAPKDVVNRVFRELPVELVTIERVANALGVEAHTLYKTADELPPEAPTPARQPASRWLIAGTAGLAVALLVVFLARNYSTPTADTVAGSPPVPLTLGVSTLVVLTFSGDADGEFSNQLRNVLATDYSVANSTAEVLVDELDLAAIAEKLRADAVIDGEVVSVGRLTAIRAFVFSNGVRRQVWADSWPTVTSDEQHERVAAAIALSLSPDGDDSPPHFPLAPVQDNYLEGQLHLSQPSSELNIKRAQSRFEAALRQDANYARAHAGLCDTLLEEHWMSDEERALEDAARTCGQALQLDPDDAVVAAAHAAFLQRTGRKEESISLYEKIIAAHPNDSTALSGLASVLLDEYRRSGDREFLLRAKAAAREAADVDPYVWKPSFALATYEWFDGNVEGAIAASERAISRDENEFVLANLGTFYLCDGAFEDARDAYQRAKDLNPDSYVGDEFLGMAYYFLGEFEQSARLRQRAIDAIATGAPEIHEMWGNLGDSYRQTGNKQRAIEAYSRAAEIAERDHLRGNAPVADRAARYFYYTAISELAPGSVPNAVMRTINDEIDATASELGSATAHRRMAQTYVLRGELDKALQSSLQATSTCRGYAKWPDLAPLFASPDTQTD